MGPIRLIATDFDGTLTGEDEFNLFTPFREKLAEIRGDNGAVWAVCTGRSLPSLRKHFAPMLLMGIEPDYVIVKHAFIYGRTRYGFMPHVMWNLEIRRIIWSAQFGAERNLAKWHTRILAQWPGTETRGRGRSRLSLRLPAEQAAAEVEAFLRERVTAHEHLQVFRFGRDVEVVSIPFTKGLAVSELARHLGLTREQVLAAGDGRNDVSMLDGTVAAMTGCPANADAEVVQAVLRSRGHIAGKNALGGMLEILHAFTNGTVSSKLPEGWTPAPRRRRGRGVPSRRAPAPRRPVRGGWSFVIFAGAVYAGLVVFASFGLVPFAGLLLRPYRLVLKIIGRLAGI